MPADQTGDVDHLILTRRCAEVKASLLAEERLRRRRGRAAVLLLLAWWAVPASIVVATAGLEFWDYQRTADFWRYHRGSGAVARGLPAALAAAFMAFRYRSALPRRWLAASLVPLALMALGVVAVAAARLLYAE